MITYDGILLCDKPYGMSSHKAIENLRQTIGQKKIGHTGTLDPRATGLLIVCLGRATKIAQFLAVSDKTYICHINDAGRLRWSLLQAQEARIITALTVEQ